MILRMIQSPIVGALTNLPMKEYSWVHFYMLLVLHTIVYVFIDTTRGSLSAFLSSKYHIILRTIINFVFEDWPLTNCNMGRVNQALFFYHMRFILLLHVSISFFIYMHIWMVWRRVIRGLKIGCDEDTLERPIRLKLFHCGVASKRTLSIYLFELGILILV